MALKKERLLKQLHLAKSKEMTMMDRIVLLLTVGGFFLVLFLAGQFVWFNWAQESAANHLPADETVLYLELTDLNLQNRIQDKAAESKKILADNLGQIFGVDLSGILSTWGNDHLALAVIKDEYQKNQPLLFVHAKTKSGALKYFRSLLLENEKLMASENENPIYGFERGQPFAFRFTKKYVVIAKSAEALKLLPEENGALLTNEENYQTSVANLPRNAWMTGYLNLQKLSFSQNVAVSNMVEPLKKAIRHLAFTVQKDQEGFHFNSFMNLNQNLLSLEKGSSKTKFAYQLADYIPNQNVALYFGGADLEAEWQNTLDSISNLNPAYGIILEGILRAQLNQVFGGQIEPRNDIYPLFQGEYALAIGNREGRKTFSLILAHEDREFVETKMEKLAGGFKFLASRFAPKVKVVTLPDGTESRELVPDEDQIRESDESQKGFNINCTEVAETNSGLCYSITDETLIITNSKNLILQAIDVNQESGTFLSQNPSFRKSLSNLSKINDEVSYVDFDQLSSLNQGSPYLLAISPILSLLDSAAWVKHYFKDGVSTEGYILVK